MATSYTIAIQQLYVAYFNRPADPDGLAYWETVAARTRGDLTSASRDFAASAEYRSKYANMTNDEIVGQIYENLFGRPAEAAGQKYWVDLFNAGKVTIDFIVREVSKGARGSDAEIVENRAKAAKLFTEALDTPIEIDNYKKAAGGELGRAFLNKITDDASYTSATSGDALDKFLAPLSQVPVIKLDLTVGADSLTGTAGADQFFAGFAGIKADGGDATTLQANDVLDGGAGEDLLTIHVGDGFNEVLRGTFKNIETIQIDNDGGVLGKSAGFINASKFEGAREVWQMYDAVAVTHLGANMTAGFKSTVDKTLDVDADGATAAIKLQTVKGNDDNVVDIVVGGGILNKVVIDGTIARKTTGTGAPGVSVALDVTTGQDAKGLALPTLVITTAFDTVLTVGTTAQSGSLNKVDLSTSSGNFTYDAESGDITSIVGGKGSDKLALHADLNAKAKAASLDGGEGSDVLLLEATNADDVTGITAAVRGGAGADTITVNVTDGATKAIVTTIEGGAGDDTIHLKSGDAYRFLTANDKLSGGEGFDTLVLSTGAGTVTEDQYKKLNALSGIERVKFANAVTGLDASLMNKVGQIEFTSAAEVTKLAASQTVIANANTKVTTVSYSAETGNNAAATANVDAVKTATLDVYAKQVNVTVDAVTAKANVIATLTGDVDAASFALKSNANGLASAVVNSANAGEGFVSLGATGTGSITVDNSAGKLKSISTTELEGKIGNTTINGLTFTGNADVAESISVGAGRDALTLASYAGNGSAITMDTVTGFALASDTFRLDLSDLDTDATVFVKATLPDTITLKSTLAQALDAASALTTDAVVFTFKGDTYLFVEDQGGATDNGALEATDFVVKLVGTSYNTDALIAMASESLNTL